MIFYWQKFDTWPPFYSFQEKLQQYMHILCDMWHFDLVSSVVENVMITSNTICFILNFWVLKNMFNTLRPVSMN